MGSPILWAGRSRMKRYLPSILNLILLLALAAMCTYWILQFVALREPRQELTAVPATDRVPRTQPLDVGPSARLFGASAGFVQERIRLTGVIAVGGRGAGVALLSLDGRPAGAYRAGEEIEADTTLTEVHADRVLIRGADGIREVRLPESPAPDGIVPVR